MKHVVTPRPPCPCTGAALLTIKEGQPQLLQHVPAASPLAVTPAVDSPAGEVLALLQLDPMSGTPARTYPLHMPKNSFTLEPQNPKTLEP